MIILNKIINIKDNAILIAINGKNVENLSHIDVIEILTNLGSKADTLAITFRVRIALYCI